MSEKEPPTFDEMRGEVTSIPYGHMYKDEAICDVLTVMLNKMEAMQQEIDTLRAQMEIQQTD